MAVQLLPPAISNSPLQSLYRQACRGLALLLVALLLNITLLIPSAQAAILNWPSLPNWTGSNGFNPGSFQVFPTPPDTINGVRVRLTFAGDPIISNIQIDNPPAFNLTGGANPPGTLGLLIDGAARNDSIAATFRYEDPNGNLIPVENARFAIIDIDTSDAITAGGQNWNDQVIFRGRNEFAAVDVIPTLQSTINPIPNLVADPTPPANCPNAPTPANQIVLPPAIFPTANSADAYTPLLTTVGGNPAAHGRQLPADGDSNNPWLARNDCANGNVIATYPGAITSASFDYGYGPLTTAGDVPAGPLNNNGPSQQGIGFYNLFFTPVIIGTAKAVTNVVGNGDGSSTITYQVLVENYGEVDLRNVNVTENLVNTYINATSFNVQDVRIVGSTRSNIAAPFTGVANPGFNGSGNDQLIAPGFNNPNGVTLQGRVLDNNNNNIVENGGTVTLEFDVRVVPNPANALGLGPFENQVEAEGFSVNTGQRVTDVSTDGTNPDTNGNGSPADDDTPTIVTLPGTGLPRVGLSKGLVSVVAEPGGAYGADTVRATYELRIRNLGPEALNNVQITEDLANAFGAGTYTVVNPPGVERTAGEVTLVPNNAFTGVRDAAVFPDILDDPGVSLLQLAPQGTLAINGESVFRFSVDIDTADVNLLPQPLENQARATGVGDVTGTAVEDLSNDVGSVPQPGDPILANQDNPTPLTFNLNPDLRVVKRITAVLNTLGGPVPVPNINTFNDQPGDTNDNLLLQLTNGAEPFGFFEIAPGVVQPGFRVQYSVYFWNNGLATANNVQLCDVVRSPTVLSPQDPERANPNPLPTLAGFVNDATLRRNAGAALDAACTGFPGVFPPGGGVVLDGAGFDVLARNVGAFRFTVDVP